MSKSDLDKAIEEALKDEGFTPMTLEEAKKEIGFCDSYSRLECIIDLFDSLRRDDWLKLLGDEWSMCDNISERRKTLEFLLPEKTSSAMMAPEELSALAALPDLVTVYRGADRGINERGLSWSLDRATAAKFPTLTRYLAKDPVLVTGIVRRGKIIALKLDREESEVIARAVKVLSVEPIAA